MKYHFILIWIGLLLSAIPATLFGDNCKLPTGEMPGIELKSDLLKDIDLTRISDPGAVSDTLSLPKAAALALYYNPELNIVRSDIIISAADVFQESRLSNPEIEFELENFGGNGELSGFQASESVIAVGQTIELAEKRQKRTHAAELNRNLLIWDYRSTALDLYGDVAAAYLNVLAAEEIAWLTNDITKLSKIFRQTIEERVAQGGVSEIELSRANIEYLSTKMDSRRAQNDLSSAVLELVAMWGQNEVDLGKIKGVLQVPQNLPPLEALISRLSQNPQLARYSTELELASLNYKIEQANSIPDPTVSLGYKREHEAQIGAFTAGLSLPLPLFDRNKGASMAAAEQIIQVDWQEIYTQQELETELRILYQSLELQVTEIEEYKKYLLEEAELAFDRISADYAFGKYDFLDVLEAQRVLFEVRKDFIDLLLEANLTELEIEILINQKLSEIEF